MKKIATIVILSLVLAGSAFAQPFGGTGPGRGPGMGPMQGAAPAVAAPTLETLEGKLELVNAHPAIKVGALTYYVGIPRNLYGFVDGLKEGAQVKLEGYKFEVPGVKDSYHFHVEKLTLNGKTIDLSATNGRGMMGGMQGGKQGGPGSMGGRGGRGGRGSMQPGYGRR